MLERFSKYTMRKKISHQPKTITTKTSANDVICLHVTVNPI